MREEYDFDNAEQGKFYRPIEELEIPIYLEPEVESFVKKLAQEHKKNLNEIVNMLLLKDKELLQVLKPSL